MQTLTGHGLRGVWRALVDVLAAVTARLATGFAVAYGVLLRGKSASITVRFEDSKNPGNTAKKSVPLRVFWGLPKWAYPRGGVCVGSVFLTGPKPSAKVVQHEARHALQWRRYGLAMPILYWLAGSDPFTNRFEVEAGLRDGGYLR